MKNMQVLASAFLGGVLVSAAGFTNLMLLDTQPVMAALIFGVTLLAVMVLDLHLLSIKAGYLLWDSSRIRARAIHLVFTLCGNAIGAAAAGEALRKAYNKGFTAAKTFITSHFEESVWRVAVGAVFCGILMFVAAHAYRRAHGGINGALAVIGAGAAIHLCGFTHAVTDMFYVAFRHTYTGRAIATLLIGIVGNIAGALLMSLLYEYKKSNEEVAREQEEAEDAAERRHAHHHRHHSHSSEEQE